MKKLVGILGYGEVGKAIAKICQDAHFSVLIRDLKTDQLKNKRVDFLHVNIPQNKDFIKIVVKNMLELAPKLTIINSSTIPGTTREIFKKTNLPVVHSPVIGSHPNLVKSIKTFFPKIIGPVDQKSLKLAKNHFKDLKLKSLIYDNAETSEAAKLLDLTYFAWNIIYCKWVYNACQKLNLNFNQVYILNNQIYNSGYGKLLPNVIRPILTPISGPIGGRCVTSGVKLVDKFLKNPLTNLILKENKKY